MKMASDEEKIAALKAIRDKARASRLEMGEDGAFAVYDEEEDENLRRAYPEYAAGGNISAEKKEPAENERDFMPRKEVFAADEYFPEDDDEYDERERYEDPAGYDDEEDYDRPAEDESGRLPADDEEADEDEDSRRADDDDEEDYAAVGDDYDDGDYDGPAEDGRDFDDYDEDEDDDGGPDPWHAVSRSPEDDLPILNIEFNGKNLENGEFDHEDLSNANFSAANLSGVNFSGSDLRGADFSGANLTNTNLSGADLTGAVFAGAQLIGTNFTGAVMNNVVLTDVYFQDAILLDITIDDISLEELQELIEYLAQYYPHKLNLTRINLTMLDLRKIDLSRVNLRGVDFTGVDFTGVNIMELDLSECIITPEQIAQALGHVPTAMELKKILAPKKKVRKTGKFIDFTDFFLNDARNFGVYNVSGFKGMDVENLVKFGQKVFKHKEKAPVKDEEALEHIRQQNKANKEELRSVIEERKRRVLEAKRRQKENPELFNGRDRGGYQR